MILTDFIAILAFELSGKVWMSIWSSEADLNRSVNSSLTSKGVLLSDLVTALNATGYESSFYLNIYAGIGLLQCKHSSPGLFRVFSGLIFDDSGLSTL